MSRRVYPRHRGDAFDRFLTERTRDARGNFSMDKMVKLFRALDCEHMIPLDGTNGSKRMTAGTNLRNHFGDGVLHFKDGTVIKLEESDDSDL